MGHLPGDHHFYVTFRTRTQGVQMADWLKDKFPDEMTIVIQHQYSDFKVYDDRFEIGSLSFGGAAATPARAVHRGDPLLRSVDEFWRSVRSGGRPRH